MASTLKLVIISTPRDNLLRKPFPLDIIEGATEIYLQEIRIGFPFTCQLQQTVAPQVGARSGSRRPRTSLEKTFATWDAKAMGRKSSESGGLGISTLPATVPRFRHLARIEDVLTVGGERATRYGVVDQTQGTQRGHGLALTAFPLFPLRTTSAVSSLGKGAKAPPVTTPRARSRSVSKLPSAFGSWKTASKMLDDVLYWCAQFCAQHICFTPCLLGSGAHAAASLAPRRFLFPYLSRVLLPVLCRLQVWPQVFDGRTGNKLGPQLEGFGVLPRRGFNAVGGKDLNGWRGGAHHRRTPDPDPCVFGLCASNHDYHDVSIHPLVVSPYLASAPFRDAHVTNKPPATDHTVDLRTCNCAPY